MSKTLWNSVIVVMGEQNPWSWRMQWQLVHQRPFFATVKPKPVEWLKVYALCITRVLSSLSSCLGEMTMISCKCEWGGDVHYFYFWVCYLSTTSFFFSFFSIPFYIMSSSWESKLTPREVNVYKQYFQAAAKSQPNVVSGMEAVQFFAKSGLPNDMLSQASICEW